MENYKPEFPAMDEWKGGISTASSQNKVFKASQLLVLQYFENKSFTSSTLF